MNWLEIAAKAVPVISFVGGVLGFCIRVWREMKCAKKGDLCLLRKEMLEIYYKYREAKALPQYEAQNFKYLYEAYKARGGNSFIDEVHAHVVTWDLAE